MKFIITEVKNTLEGINSTLNEIEEWVSNLQDRVVDIIQSEQKKKELKVIYNIENIVNNILITLYGDRIDAFELWCWRRLLRVPWTPRRSNQSILKEISPECSLEGLMLKLKLQYFGHLMQRADSLEKTLILGRIEGERRREQHRMR